MTHIPVPETEMHSFNKLATVIYVEDAYNAEFNSFIQSNYKTIVDIFGSKGISFCYLPFLLENEEYQKVIEYNRPYLHSPLTGVSIQEIYNNLIQLQSEPVNVSALAWTDNSDILFAFPLENLSSLIDDFNIYADVINEALEDNWRSAPMFRFSSSNEFDVNENNIGYKRSFPDLLPEYNVDAKFDSEAFQLAEEIRQKISLLSEHGALSLIGDIIEEIKQTQRNLSPLFITNDYRIFLKDYDMKEVLMPPLSKCLFFLFLRHPEGILFKELSNYHDELLSIYRNITIRENIDIAIESIKAMTNPLNNSVNEKASRIRAAFLELITDDLAINYYITGRRGEPKKITLDPSLIEYQQ